jgi:hypothetical protein
MKKVLMLALALAIAAAPVFAQDKKGDKKAAGASASASKTMKATGSVTAVSADSLTVKAKDGDMTFAVDAKTNVQAAGASHKTAAAKADNKATPITDFVKVGDEVAVTYHDMGATKHAATVHVVTAKPASATKKK